MRTIASQYVCIRCFGKLQNLIIRGFYHKNAAARPRHESNGKDCTDLYGPISRVECNYQPLQLSAIALISCSGDVTNTIVYTGGE